MTNEPKQAHEAQIIAALKQLEAGRMPDDVVREQGSAST